MRGASGICLGAGWNYDSCCDGIRSALGITWSSHSHLCGANPTPKPTLKNTCLNVWGQWVLPRVHNHELAPLGRSRLLGRNNDYCRCGLRCSFNGAIPTPKPTCNTTIILLDHVVPLLFGFQLYQLTTSTKQIFDLPIL